MKQMIEPVFIDDSGVKRFYQNKIICAVISYMRDKGVYILNELHRADDGTDDFIDDYRHFNQLLGYSVCGFADLRVAHTNGDDYGGYDGYMDYIDNMPVTDFSVIKHPVCEILTYDKVEIADGFIEHKMKFKGNKVLQYIFINYPLNLDSFLESDQFSIGDKRQFLQLLGKTFEEYFEYSFNKVEMDCSGESMLDVMYRNELFDSLYSQTNHINYGGKNDLENMIGKKVKTNNYELLYEDQPPKSAYDKVGTVIASYEYGDELLFTIKFDENYGYINNRGAFDQWDFRRGEFREI